MGIEPTETEANGVTDRPSSPTLAPAHISGHGIYCTSAATKRAQSFVHMVHRLGTGEGTRTLRIMILSHAPMPIRLHRHM
mgnify:CR=1 FL=1